MKKNRNQIKALRMMAFWLLATLSFLPMGAQGDTLELKDGTKVEGTIVSEAGDSVQIETTIRNIKETKTYPKSDIANIIKLTPDQIAFDSLKPLATSRDLMGPEEYDAIITRRIQPFLDEYPTSPLKAEAEKLLTMYQEERAKAREGSRKYKDQWIPPDDFENRGYLILAEVLEKEFDAELQANNIPAAMRAFSQLEENHKATMNYHDAVVAAKNVLPQAEKAFKAARIQAEQAHEDWKKRLATNRPEDRALIEAALKREQTLLDNSIKAEQAAGIKWITPHPTNPILNKNAYSILEKLATSELQRLNSIRLPEIKQAAEAVEDAVAAISAPEPTEANLAGAELAIRKAENVLRGSDFMKSFNNRLTRERTAISVREQAKKDEERKRIDAENQAATGSKELDVNPFAAKTSSKAPPRKALTNNSGSTGGSPGAQTSVPPSDVDFSGGGGFLQYALIALGIVVVVFLVITLKKRRAS